MRPFSAPFDVRLYNNKKSKIAFKEIYTVVQPDLCVICDENKLDERGCFGAPDLVIEILSPSNSKKEMNEKFDLYEETGVREYWLVEPSENVIYIYVLNEDGKYIGLKPVTTVLKSSIIPDLEINLDEIFE